MLNIMHVCVVSIDGPVFCVLCFGGAFRRSVVGSSVLFLFVVLFMVLSPAFFLRCSFVQSVDVVLYNRWKY
jgi:hypothetical protein